LSLRQAVESLLKPHEETDNFLDTPAYQGSHSTYDAACVYALSGKSEEAVDWLKENRRDRFS
jgi:hypothetical protein